MKKLIFIASLLLVCGCAFGQQKVLTRYMLITILEDGNYIGNGNSLNMIITKEDGNQEKKHIDLNLHVSSKEHLAAHDALVMKALSPYFDDGWKLVTTYSEVSVSRGESNIAAIRYFLSKE